MLAAGVLLLEWKAVQKRREARVFECDVIRMESLYGHRVI